MNIFGIIGYPLQHSRSPEFYNQFFKQKRVSNVQYKAFPIEKLSLLPKLIQDNPDLCGLNVTSPYKQEIISYLDTLDVPAQKMESVNTIKIIHHENKIHLTGYNTDAPAFSEVLCKLWHHKFSSALIFGTGGAAQAAGYALLQLAIPFQFVSRRASENAISYEQLTAELVQQTPLLINATPVGMLHTEHQKLPIPYRFISSNHYLFDMIYAPKETFFLSEGKKNGASIQNGEQMFINQAKLSLKIWNF